MFKALVLVEFSSDPFPNFPQPSSLLLHPLGTPGQDFLGAGNLSTFALPRTWARRRLFLLVLLGNRRRRHLEPLLTDDIQRLNEEGAEFREHVHRLNGFRLGDRNR